MPDTPLPNAAPDDDSTARTTKVSGQAFIPSTLDTAGLSASEFRVWCHISRVGECFEAPHKMSEVCRLNEDTVWDALKSLVGRSMLSKIARFGRTSIYTVLPASEWKGGPTGKEGVPEKRGYPLESDTGYRKRGGTHLPEKRGYKGTPSEGNPLKDSATPLPTHEPKPLPSICSADASLLSGKSSANRKRKQAAATVPSEHTRFIGEFATAYMIEHGEKYLFDDQKDPRAAQWLVRQNIPIADLISLAKRAWKADGWYCRNKSRTIFDFRHAFRSIKNELNGSGGRGNGVQPNHEAGF